MPHVFGTFTVKLTQLPLFDEGAAAVLGRMSIEKVFEGSLSATSRGEMLSAGTAVQGSAGYVAIERVDGALQGLAGTFVLQHTGLMHRGAQELKVIVLPDSGTGQLEGLRGSMHITIVEGIHHYEFDYDLAP
jgi:hypothetical protein